MNFPNSPPSSNTPSSVFGRRLDEASWILRPPVDPETALWVAAWNDHPDVVLALIASGFDVCAKQDLALRMACAKGHVGIVHLLLNAGADPEVLDGQALILAHQGGHTEIVAILREYQCVS